MPFEGEGRRSGQKGGFAESVNALAPALLGGLGGEAERLLPLGLGANPDFEMVEKALRASALELAAALLENRLNADRADGDEKTRPCRCGGEARYAGRREKVFIAALGELKLDRAYYHCAQCESGFCPRDRDLGMGQGSVAAAVARMTGMAAGQLSFAKSSEIVRELAGVRLDAKRMERVAERLGGEVFDDEARGIDVESGEADTMCLGIDGTGIPMRASECAGGEGRQADGSAKTREVKLVAVWTAQSRSRKTGLPQRGDGSVSCGAAIVASCRRGSPEGWSAKRCGATSASPLAGRR